jgi:hypothetical protein
MIKAPVRLQDLRRRIYVKAKADMFCGFRSGNFRASAGGGGVGGVCRSPTAARQLSGSASFSESRSGKIGHISFGAKQTRKPSAGNLHAGFDEAGTGNQLTVWLVRHSQRKRRETDRPNLQSMAPVLDPTNCRSSPGKQVKLPIIPFFRSALCKPEYQRSDCFRIADYTPGT